MIRPFTMAEALGSELGSCDECGRDVEVYLMQMGLNICERCDLGISCDSSCKGCRDCGYDTAKPTCEPMGVAR